MDEQIKQQIILKITSTASKTIEETVKQSLKRLFHKNSLTKRCIAIKLLERLSIPEFKQN